VSPGAIQAGPVNPPVLIAPAVHEIADEAERQWQRVLLQRLRDMKRYPMAARRLGQEGVVLIEARIAPDGHLESATVKRGSGFALLDNDALRLLEAAAEAARAQLRSESQVRLEVPVVYRLDQ
jgi:protein TonB